MTAQTIYDTAATIGTGVLKAAGAYAISTAFNLAMLRCMSRKFRVDVDLFPFPSLRIAPKDAHDCIRRVYTKFTCRNAAADDEADAAPGTEDQSTDQSKATNPEPTADDDNDEKEATDDAEAVPRHSPCPDAAGGTAED